MLSEPIDAKDYILNTNVCDRESSHVNMTAYVHPQAGHVRDSACLVFRAVYVENSDRVRGGDGLNSVCFNKPTI
jgi:hypothetical protein